MVDEKRKSHAGTLVGPDSSWSTAYNGSSLCKDLEDFNWTIQGLAMDYVKQFCAASGNPLHRKKRGIN